MTTQVMILNKSTSGKNSKSVKVEVIGRDEAGKFINVSEHRVEPGRFVELYVFDTQSLQVHELDD